jgi:hypothetical protein
MTDEDLIERLLYTGEGITLDYKRQGYITDGADPIPKSELLKDILAFSNTWRSEPAYILIGVDNKDQSIFPVDRHPDDSRLQELINSKTNRPIVFSYRPVTYRNQSLGLYTIEVQERPIFAKKKFGNVDQNAVYVRRGSSTTIADPEQIAKMGAIDAQRMAAGKPQLSIDMFRLNDQSTLNGGFQFEYKHLLLEDYPDYKAPAHGYVMNHSVMNNRQFYRELALHEQEKTGALGFRVRVANKGNAPANSVRVHLGFEPAGTLRLVSELAELPSTEFNLTVPNILNPAHAHFDVQEDFDRTTAVFNFGKIHAGEEVLSSDVFLITPPADLTSILVRVHADELSVPISFSIPVAVTAHAHRLGFSELRRIAQVE